VSTLLDPFISSKSHQRKLDDKQPARSPLQKRLLSKKMTTQELQLIIANVMCVFTCAVTRAVHLELVPDLSARSFLLAFRRFAARRGPVSVMYSDNAQTFRCVSRHLNILQADPSVQDLLARRNLLWIFSASLAPWWGGFWERMVRSVKDLLRRSNGRACLAYDELEASLIEIESVINARPLNYIVKALTIHFLLLLTNFLTTGDQHVQLRSPPSICWLLHPQVLCSSSWTRRGENTSAAFVPVSSKIT
jgi:hypothetical protein